MGPSFEADQLETSNNLTDFPKAPQQMWEELHFERMEIGHAQVRVQNWARGIKEFAQLRKDYGKTVSEYIHFSMGLASMWGLHDVQKFHILDDFSHSGFEHRMKYSPKGKN